LSTVAAANNFGGFQQVMRAPADFAYVLPDNLSSAAAAPLLCAGEPHYSSSCLFGNCRNALSAA
jgi:D-arabinose 1-dehydrogenase-like Zn-dependent alcohol dehydrogenase